MKLYLTTFLMTNLLLVFVHDAAAQSQANVGKNLKPDKILTYKVIGDVDLKLHVFQPADWQDTDSSPAIVFFFGGGWTGGSPKQFYEQAKFLAGKGVVAFSAEYRVKRRNGTTPFECVSDGKSAIRWVRENAKELGINPKQIVAAGGSAGGHVAACTGLIQGFEEKDDDKSIESIPNAMILFNPVLDTTEKGFGRKRFSEGNRTKISPCHHVRAGIAPTLLFHGTADKTVPFENAERFTRLMKAAGNRCDLKSFAGKGHGFFNGKAFNPKLKDTSSYDQTMTDTVVFLRSIGFLSQDKNTGS